MNFELTVAESFDSSWSLLQSLHINFLTSNSCECPHRLLDLIVKERDELVVVGCASYAFPGQSQAYSASLCFSFRLQRSAAALSVRRHYRDLELNGKGKIINFIKTAAIRIDIHHFALISSKSCLLTGVNPPSQETSTYLLAYHQSPIY